jgi:hypothetical protein
VQTSILPKKNSLEEFSRQEVVSHRDRRNQGTEIHSSRDGGKSGGTHDFAQAAGALTWTWAGGDAFRTSCVCSTAVFILMFNICFTNIALAFSGCFTFEKWI